MTVKHLIVAVVLLMQTGLLAGPWGTGLVPPCQASPLVTPWSTEAGFQNLVYGSSTPWDVETAVGRPPDETVYAGQMYPVIVNHYYFDDSGSGAATVFVYENGFLVGMHYKTPGNQLMDLTYLLINKNDRYVNAPYLGGFRGYFPTFQFLYAEEEDL